jgi:hypothetical protein
MPKRDQSIADRAITYQSITDQFWQYAKETTLSAATAKTDDERQSLLALARIWTQAALQQRSFSADPDTALPPLPPHLLDLIERRRDVPARSQSCPDPFEHSQFYAPEKVHHAY